MSLQRIAERLPGLRVPYSNLFVSSTIRERGGRGAQAARRAKKKEKKLTWPSYPPVANFRSRASHSTHRTELLWPESVCDGVSVNRSHKRAVASPEPVARRFPVGEKDAQRMRDE
jgi:hypothetical protein